MSVQDFKEIKKAFREASETLNGTLDDFRNTNALKKKGDLFDKAKQEIQVAERKVSEDKIF